MKSYLFYLLLMASLVFLGCNTNVDFEGEFYPPEPVVYGNLNGDSTISVRVTYSASAQAGVLENMRNIEDARVVLIENQKDSIKINHNQNGNYLGSYIPNPESDYQLYVESKYGKMLSNKIQINDKPEVRDIKFTPYTKGYFNYTNSFECSILIPDNMNQIIRVKAKYYDHVSKRFNTIYLSGIDGQLIEYCGGYNASDAFVFATECNTSDKLEIALALSINEIPEDFRNRLYIQIANASEEYEEFEGLLYDYSAFDLFFEEPLPPYSSFDNGYGYFAAFNEVNYVFDLN